MLLLVGADGDVVRLIEQYVRRHEAGVGEESSVDVVDVLGALILELRHAAELTEHRVAVEHPAQLRVLVHMALDEEGVLLRVEPARDVLRELGGRVTAKLGGVLAHGDGVHIHDAVIACVFVRECHPVFQRAEVAAQMHIAGGLNAGEHYLFRRRCIFLCDVVFHGCLLWRMNVILSIGQLE